MTAHSIRAGTAEDWPAVASLLREAFHDPYDEEVDRVERAVFEPDRSLVATDAGAVVGHAAAYTRDLTVPGAVLPAAHVSMVGVAPTHRRRGVLTALMGRQLAELPEPVAVLCASEAGIYPRYGYGLATVRVGFTVETRRVRLPELDRPSRLRGVSPQDARDDLARVYESVRAARPGWSSRDDRWWAHVLADPAHRRTGATERRAILHEGGDGVDGYALWRTRGGWRETGPAGEVLIDEVVGADPTAHLALWRFLLALDLVSSARYRFGALDDPLLHLVGEPRRLAPTLADGLFLRIVDLPAGLSARRYAAPVDVVIEVTDPLLPRNAGRWRVTGDPDRATCTGVEAPADLACDIADLGAAYLGGTSLAALAAAGRVRQLRPDTLAQASTGFGWHRAPAGIEMF
jgi:predicted acetyltransferase